MLDSIIILSARSESLTTVLFRRLAGLSAVHTQFDKSHVELTAFGFKVQPLSPWNQVDSSIGIFSIKSCAYQCNKRQLCRYFEYVTSTTACRIFLDGAVIASVVPTVRVGTVRHMPELYSSYVQTCTSPNCQINRYLTCDLTNTCRCLLGLFWNGTVCAGELLMIRHSKLFSDRF